MTSCWWQWLQWSPAADWSAVSPAFSLAGKSSATLTFYNKYKTESGYDFARVEISTLFEEIEVAASFGAKAKGVMFSVTNPGEPVAVDVDSQIVAAILVNLVQNAIKFTNPQGHVVLSARATRDRVSRRLGRRIAAYRLARDNWNALPRCAGREGGRMKKLTRSFGRVVLAAVALGYVLVASTLVSMIDRATTPFRSRSPFC